MLVHTKSYSEYIPETRTSATAFAIFDFVFGFGSEFLTEDGAVLESCLLFFFGVGLDLALEGRFTMSDSPSVMKKPKILGRRVEDEKGAHLAPSFCHGALEQALRLYRLKPFQTKSICANLNTRNAILTF